MCEHGGWVLGEGVCVRVGVCVNMAGGYWGEGVCVRVGGCVNIEGGYWGRVCVCEGGSVCKHGGWVLGGGRV